MAQDSRTQRLLERLAKSDTVAAQLGPGRVALVLSAADSSDPQAQLITLFAANLLARLFPVVRQLDVFLAADAAATASFPRWSESTVSGTLRRLFRELKPPTRCAVHDGLPRGRCDAILVIGDDALTNATLYAGSNGWIAQIATDGPVPVGEPLNPIGAYTAACFATAEVWKQLLYTVRSLFPGVPVCPLRGRRTFSSFDYGTNADSPNPPLPVVVTLPNLTLAGLGAGGAATAFALASLPEVSGRVMTIEPDEVTDTNLNRLVPATAVDVELKRAKTDVVAELFARHKQLSLTSFSRPFDVVRTELQPVDFAVVIAAVHSRAARHSIQLETPRVLWDAGATGTGEFFLWRVDFGRTPCLACRLSSQDADPERAKAQQLHLLLGMTPEDWHRKIRDNGPFTKSEIDSLRTRLEQAGGIIPAPVVGQRFGDWEAEHCGKLHLPDPDDEIPIPFAPVLAGVLLAGEAVKNELFPEAVLDSYYWNTLVGNFMIRNRPRRPRPRPGCPVCGKSAFQEQYRRRWLCGDLGDQQ